jgi:hypothetical protein
LSADEQSEYDNLEKTALDFYTKFRAQHEKDLSKYYLKLSQKLTPMRVACSGGTYPLEDINEEEDTDNDASDEEMDDEPRKDRKKKKEVKYSDYAFTSKFKVLLSELERIRDEDPTCKFACASFVAK